MKKENKVSNKTKKKNFSSFVYNFPARIITAKKYLARMQDIISSYGLSNDQRLFDTGISCKPQLLMCDKTQEIFDNNKLIDFSENKEFHKLDSWLNGFLDIANDYRLDYKLNNNPRMSRFNSDIEKLFDMYKELQSQIGTVDRCFYRPYKNNNHLNDSIDSENNDFSDNDFSDNDFSDNEPSDYELMRIQKK